MQERTTFVDFLAHALAVYGFTLIVLNVFALIIGDYAQGYTSVFSLGGTGIAVSTSLQFLALSFVVVGLRYLFFTDLVIKSWALWARRLAIFVAITVVVAIFSYWFAWFPVGEWQAWVVFYQFFGVSALVSSLVMSWKERDENRQLAHALEQYKQTEMRSNGTGPER